MRRRPKSRRPDAGATLVEVLVSLALLTLLALLLVQGIAAGRGLWQGVARRAATAESIEGAEALLRWRLERMAFVTQYNAIPPYPGFEGSESAMTFYAAPPADMEPNALRRYSLELTAGGDVVLTSRSDLWGSLPDRMIPPPKREVLLRGAQSINLSYFDTAGGSGENGIWQSNWHMRRRPPSLIRLKIGFAPGDSRWWPDLIVRPFAMIDPDCVLAVGTGRCGGRT